MIWSRGGWDQHRPGTSKKAGGLFNAVVVQRAYPVQRGR
jgi:hypothetical protein